MANKPAKPATAPVSAPAATIAIAPAHPAGVGKASPGGHVKAWRAQPAFNPAHSIKLVSTVNPWQHGKPGWHFYTQCLANGQSTTIAQAIQLGGQKLGLRPQQVQKHLAWLYTWGGAYLEVNGKLYPAQP